MPDVMGMLEVSELLEMLEPGCSSKWCLADDFPSLVTLLQLHDH